MENEQNELQQVDSYVARSLSADVPPEVAAHARQRLASLRERMDAAKSNPPRNIIMELLGNSRLKKRLLWSTPIVVVAIIAVMFVLPELRTGGEQSAYAAVAQQLRQAMTMTCTMTTEMPVPDMPPMIMLCQAKQPGLLRLTASVKTGENSVVATSITDLNKKRAITLMAEQKQYIEQDLSQAPPEQMRAADMINNLTTLPDRADEVLGTQKMDGKTVRGYRVAENGLTYSVWVDADSGELFRIDEQIDNAKEAKITITDFQFNVALDDNLFSLEPPAGYTKLDMPVASSQPSEEHLIEFLRYWATNKDIVPDGTFPPTLDSVKLMQTTMKSAKERNFKSAFEQSRKAALAKKNAAQQAPQTKSMKPSTRPFPSKEEYEQVMKSTLGMMFAMKMKPENDFHYAGKDVKIGDAATPICWYKPTGAATYRVIYGDLTVHEKSTEEVTKFDPVK